ncbi:MAG: hypothetical protein MZW92_40765 [Comamonadaceae bacterium]|nr:hypothetical protein [Comamonadaceae bacterium]
MITGLVEEDSRFGTLFAELQEPLARSPPDPRTGRADDDRGGGGRR